MHAFAGGMMAVQRGACIEVTMASEDEDTTTYDVVVNDEEQYSIWPQDRELPAGWRRDGTSGSKAVCLDHIERVWTDMRPLSVRQRADDAG
jgi:MbtH protein